MISICIGIISYLPDDEEIRKVRIERLEKLLNQCDRHFKLPVIIVAQNWKDYLPPQTGKKVVYLFKEKLGITKARIELRDKFLDSTYRYLLMLDDDMAMSENQFDYDHYIRTILEYNMDYYYVDNFLNNFSCISRNGFLKVNYDESVDAEKGTGFEDWIFNETCKKKLRCYKIKTNLPAGNRRTFLDDKYSTWDPSNKELNAKNDSISSKIIESIKKTS